MDDPSERESLTKELKRELSPAHILHGVDLVAIGRKARRDDVLFRLHDGRVAQVHLTWRPETDPIWPFTVIYADFEDWKSVPVADR
ncbi:hypothetical protein FNJ84_16960 [Paracoccus sp. M683]|nr:hypothetical protein FNJ84_16960 [Paracoccus sp. M683]